MTAAPIFPSADYLADWRFEAGPERRHQASQKAGRAVRLRGEKTMAKRIKIDELPEFDAAPYLDSEEAIAAYLTDILEANDAGLLAAALGDIARARGMTEIANSAGITREALYKALRPGSEPRFETVNRVCAALGVRLVAQPAHPQPN
jgi:probable addiction module antidote protein